MNAASRDSDELLAEEGTLTTPRPPSLPQADLLADQKEIAEHVMLVDLGRNDVGKVRAQRAAAAHPYTLAGA